MTDECLFPAASEKLMHFDYWALVSEIDVRLESQMDP